MWPIRGRRRSVIERKGSDARQFAKGLAKRAVDAVLRIIVKVLQRAFEFTGVWRSREGAEGGVEGDRVGYEEREDRMIREDWSRPGAA